MALTKKKLLRLRKEVEESKARIKVLKGELSSEYEKVTNNMETIINNCDHIIVVSDYDPDEGWDEDDEPIYYHTCIKCGLTTQKNNYLETYFQTYSIYGYNTKVHMSAYAGETKLKELLEENPDMSDEEIVKRFIKDYNNEDVKKLKLTKENTSYAHS